MSNEEGAGLSLTPDDSLLVQEIIDHFDAVPHLGLCPLGHRDHRAANLPWLDVIKRGDAFRPALFQLLFVACHAYPPYAELSNSYARESVAMNPRVLLA